ncbi:hypothetical protein CC86DRAFT_449837 [Ophiobolus disseminans]|uniref:Uncharacterized protein n=1 Tax=Ophiobolus disseminans TaxID=1469910 RepID=A0A6A6ZFB7_9PLEO|nr:hypothetical protein CC86DRAFT_449837 [Ophiobolus disseminans]
MLDSAPFAYRFTQTPPRCLPTKKHHILPPPSYSAATANPTSQTHAFISHIAHTRTAHITSTVTQHILPVIHTHARLGIARTTIALLPCATHDTFTSSSAGSAEIVGVAGGDQLNVVRLQGLINGAAFWREAAVVRELEDWGGVPMRSVLRRVVGTFGEEKRVGNKGVCLGVGVDADVGVVHVEARVEEVFLRTVNEFGLYDTLSGECVVVNVHVHANAEC